jgi:integrase
LLTEGRVPVIKRVTLTKQMVEGVKPRPSPYRLWDAKVPGLALRVLASGRSTYEVHWGRNKSQALGTNGVMTLEGARVAARQMLGEVAEHGAPLDALAEAGAGKATTFGDFLSKRYGPHIEATNKAGKETAAALKAQFSFLDDKLLAAISRADFDDFKAKRLNAGISPATVNRDMDRLKAALSQAVEWKLLTVNPMLGIKRITRGIEDRVRYLSTTEDKAFRKALEAREAAAKVRRTSGNAWRAARGRAALKTVSGYSDHLMPMALVAVNTGLRRGELTQLTWADIDLHAKRLTVRAGYAKSGKARHVPLNSEATAVLKKYRKDHFGTGQLFAVASVTKSWRTLMADAKIEDFRFHDLRHTFASRLVMAGVDLNTVRELMGHGDIKMTLRYAHLAPEHKAAAVEMIVSKHR